MKDSLIDEPLKERFEQSDYLEKYGGEGFEYQKCAWEFTIPLSFLTTQLAVHGTPDQPPQSMLDIGAATGIVQQEVQKELNLAGPVHGVEIAETIWKQRVSDNVFWSDILQMKKGGQLPDFARPDETIQLQKYDIVFANMLMYLKPPEIEKFLGLILPQVLKPSSLVFIIFAYDVSTHMVSEYVRDGYSLSYEDPVPILARPKWWWTDILQRKGFVPVGDDGGGSMVFRLRHDDDFPRESYLTEYEIRYPSKGDELLQGLRAPVIIRTDGIERVFTYTWDEFEAGGQKDIAEFWQEVNPITGQPDPLFPEEEHIPEEAVELASIAAMFRTGKLGYNSNVRFRPYSQYIYHPGIVTLKEGDYWQPYSDSYLSAAPPIDYVVRWAHPDWLANGHGLWDLRKPHMRPKENQ